MSRILEELIECFIEKGVILLSDLLVEAVYKICHRRNLRADIQEMARLLLNDTDKII